MKFTHFFSKQRILGLALVLILPLVVYAMLAKAKDASYLKLDPYTVELSISGAPASTVFLSYDYGYGIRDEHIRPLVLDDANNDFVLSVSAWKHVHALYFIAPKDNQYFINSLKIEKNGVEYYPSLPDAGPTLEGDNWMYRLPLVDFNYQ